MGEIKRIGILTSGGDCAGLNAVIRAVTHCAVGIYGWEVLGICKATQGLMSRPPQVMSLEINKVDPLLTMGGTVLGTTNKGDPFAFPLPDGTVRDRSEEIIEGYHKLGLNALTGSGKVQSVEGFSSNIDSSIKADRAFSNPHIVVNRFGNPY